MRPYHLAACVSQAVHETFELAAGTGIIAQAQLGLPGAIAASALMLTTWARQATRRRPNDDATLAAAAGVSVAVPVIHFTIWPWRVTRGLPVLTEAEGLPRRLLPAYNAVLYAWGISGVLALIRDTRRGRRRYGLAGIAAAAAFRPVAVHHFRWLEAEAQRNPRWWNRAWVSP